MRRIVFLTLGILELVVAAILAYLGLSLRCPSEVSAGFGGVEKTTRGVSGQGGTLRRQVAEVRQPEMLQLAQKLQTQTESVTATLKKQHVDYETVASLRTSLSDVATGLDGIAETLDPERIGQLGTGLGETAKYLDDSVIPISGKAADQLDETAAALGKDAEKLSSLLKESAPDLTATSA